MFTQTVKSIHIVHYLQTPTNRDNFEQPEIWTLYLTATAPARTGSEQVATTSPRAILERYIGSNTAVDAPEWTLWTRSVEKLQQPRAAFGVLFTRMALWKDNRDQVCRLYPCRWCGTHNLVSPAAVGLQYGEMG